MQHSISAILSATNIFGTLTATQLELIASICVFEIYPKGHMLLNENEGSDELYIIGQGSVEVLLFSVVNGEKLSQRSAPILLAELQQGRLFGEVALVDQGLRTASVKISQDDTQLLRIPRNRLMLLCDTYPELGYKIMKNLAADLALKIRNFDLTARLH